ncbi:Sec-independent protein translocase protein tatA/E-like protein [Desulfovibrio sp. X2]|uniref:twin-arginine translocase TatA/TatE family subunit n=1 Tax=Desulfovibrio sp. X2 TaxID=941449 RepID=UPI000358B953|nr:twin-arginine translocase TatA/TatE family subunit [Desulfovibrio sp. X2]EPR42171.1 Sec-independent protein translocase protein tatA/E-like protein [Desulfovibrio sp. X2]
MGGLGSGELLIILVIVVILFGANKLPEIGSGIGKAIRNFKKSTSEPDEIDVTPGKHTVDNSAKSEKTEHKNSGE